MTERQGILVKGEDLGDGRMSLDFWKTERLYNNDHSIVFSRCTNCKEIIIEEPAGTLRLGVLPHSVNRGCTFNETTKDLINEYKKLNKKLIKTLKENKEHFFCSKCGDITTITDYDHKDHGLYVSLHDGNLCEACANP